MAEPLDPRGVRGAGGQLTRAEARRRETVSHPRAEALSPAVPGSTEIRAGWLHARARGEPRFAARLLGIVAFADGLPLVAHNAAFDLGVTRDAADESGIAWPTTTYACTLVIARRTYALLSSSLPWVTETAGVPLASRVPASAMSLATDTPNADESDARPSRLRGSRVTAH